MEETANTLRLAISIDALVAIGTLLLIAIGLATLFLMVRANQKSDNAEFRKEMRESMSEFRSEMRESFAEMRADNAGFRSEMRESFAEMKSDNAEFRREMRESMSEFRSEVREYLSEMKSDNAQFRVEMRELANRVNGVELEQARINGAMSARRNDPVSEEPQESAEDAGS